MTQCPQCGSNFERKGPQKYCSMRCVRLSFNERFQARTGHTYAAYQWRKHWAPEEREAEKAKLSKQSGIRRHFPLSRRPRLTGGVWHQVDRKGHPYFVATVILGKRKHYVYKRKWFSVSRLGESGAKLAATLQRLCWLIDMEVWRPDDGDPLAILNYTDMLKGNADYENSEVTDQSSPYLTERE